ncbi:MBL fold metallo-hydrolase [Chloroflexota bacterium]
MTVEETKQLIYTLSREVDRMRLIDNLYCYLWTGKGNNCHSYLFADVLRGNRPHVLIDPGHVANELNERCLDRLVSTMERDGIKIEDVGLIMSTHSHPDHCEANQAIVNRSRVESGTSAARRALVALHEEEAEYQRATGHRLASLLPTDTRLEADFYLKEGNLNLGKEAKVTLEVLHTPGHSPGSISLYWPARAVLMTGDVSFYGSVGRTDIPGGDGTRLKKSIERLSQLDVEYFLPGHSTEFGSIIEGKEKVQQNFGFIRLNYFRFL